MFALVSGIAPAKIVRAASAPFLIAALAICQAGCASDNNVYYAKEPAVAAYVAKAPTADVEADGLPTQPPPSMRIRQMPDDPSEPYSRNYGGPNPAAADAVPAGTQKPVGVAKAAIPADLPADFRRRLVAAVDSAD
jgi:hypothetical protein